ncbi:MAG: hypothetical protein IJH12_01955 [Clostridia bacterium]|nr:hypothetical protein [Clostridia bacterium]
MVRRYLKTILKEQNIDFEEDENSFIIYCEGNEAKFMKMFDIVSKRIENWTYYLELPLNIKIDTTTEKIVIEYWEA